MRRVIQVGDEFYLAGGRCATCQHVTFPRRSCCPACGGSPLLEVPLGPEATVEDSTTLHVATAQFEAPYELAVARFDEGPLVLARIEAAARPGTRVRLSADPDVDTFSFTESHTSRESELAITEDHQ